MTSQDNSSSLADTVRRAQGGELTAFRELVVRFQDMVVGYAFSLLGDFHLAEDAAQEAFLAVFQDLASLRQPGAFVPWLRTVVGKHCDRISRRRRSAEPLEAEDERLVFDAPSPLDAIERDEVEGLVGRAVASLPTKQRDVVTLYYIGEQSGREVATFLDLPLTTVKKRLHDSKPRLRRSMATMAKQFLEDHRPSRDSDFSDRVLRLVAPDPSTDAAAVYRLFEAEDHPSRLEWRAGRLADSHVDWRASRIALARDGEAERLVAALNVYDLTMRIGTAEVRVAGINGDVLDADMAGSRGDILGRIASEALGSMGDEGYDLAVTFDDEAFWLRHGFALGWRALQWQVLVADLPVAKAPELERIDAVHDDGLAAVYNETSGGLTGTARRPTYRCNKHPGEFSTYLWRGADGSPAGYVSGSAGPGECFWVDEVAGDAATCLAVLRSVAETEQCTEVYFDRLHYKSAVGVLLRQMGSCRLLTGTRSGRARWYVARIVNLKSTMTKLAPTLHERLLASPLADWRGSVSICLEHGDATEAVTLVVQDGGVEVRDGAVGGNAVSGAQAIAQLLLGCEDADEVVAVNGMELRGSASDLLPVLFPALHPQMENQAL